jgi:hypothetical protein
MNCKFAGVTMYLSAVKQGLRYEKILNFIPWYASTVKCSKVAGEKLLTHHVSNVLLPYGGRGQKSPNYVRKITIFEFCMKARQIVSF